MQNNAGLWIDYAEKDFVAKEVTYDLEWKRADSGDQSLISSSSYS